MEKTTGEETGHNKNKENQLWKYKNKTRMNSVLTETNNKAVKSLKLRPQLPQNLVLNDAGATKTSCSLLYEHSMNSS